MGAMTDKREKQVWNQLALVSDPELDESVTDLGFVKEVRIDDNDAVSVQFQLPTYWCAANFAFLMAHDMQEAVRELPWVKHLHVELLDHFYANRINAGLARSASFQDTCGSEASQELDELRALFRRKAFQARQERLLSHLRQLRYSPERLCSLSIDELFDLDMGDDPVGAGLRRRYLALRRGGILDGAKGDAFLSRAGDKAFVTIGGEALQPTELPAYVRRLRTVRINMEFNGHFCRGVLAARLREQGTDETRTLTAVR